MPATPRSTPSTTARWPGRPWSGWPPAPAPTASRPTPPTATATCPTSPPAPGPNAIFQFRFDPDTGHITPNDPPRVSPREPGRPPPLLLSPQPGHHLRFQRAGVQRYRLQPGPGHRRPEPLPDPVHAARGLSGKRNSCSQIQITPNGKYVYAPNRGHDSIAGFAVGDDGRTDRPGADPLGGGAPGLRHRPHGQLSLFGGPGVGQGWPPSASTTAAAGWSASAPTRWGRAHVGADCGIGIRGYKLKLELKLRSSFSLRRVRVRASPACLSCIETDLQSTLPGVAIHIIGFGLTQGNLVLLNS